jgi:hypothetical protein
VKGGKTPIHIQRWAPHDYHDDEHVRLLKTRRDYRTLTFYRHFIDFSFLAGGDLPADPEALAAVVDMPRKDVEAALSFCLGRLIEREGDRLFQKRVARDVAAELEFRQLQSQRGKLGGRPKKESGGFHPEKPPISHSRKSPPSPAPTPIPSVERDGSSGPHPVSRKPPLSRDEPRPGEGPTNNGHGSGPPNDAPERLDPSGFLDAVKTRLVGVIPTHLHATWIRPLVASGWDGDAFVLEAPSEQHREWVRRNYAGKLKGACHELGQDCRVRITARARDPATLHEGTL